MNWKTTLEKIFLPVSQVKSTFHPQDLWKIFRPTSGPGILLSLLFTATSVVSAQSNQSSISGDNCITFDSCPTDQTVCADSYLDGVYGAYLDWQDPVVTQTCTPNGRAGNFQMLFELNEQLLTVDCWDFNYISRVGSDGGQVKLFSGEDKDRSKKSVIITPYLILKPGSETSIDIDYVNGDYTVSLSLIDENENEIFITDPLQSPLQVNSNDLTYTFFTPNTVTGIYRLKYEFVYSGKEPSNANNGDTLIAVDGMLSENDNCSAGVDFTVTAPDKGFYPVGSHDLQYVATYTAPDGTLKTKTCSFTITVTELALQFSNVNPVDCDGTGGSFNATGSGVNGSGNPPYQYSIDGINYQSSGTFNDLDAGPYTVAVKDATGCTSQAVVTIDKLSPVSANISGNELLTCTNTDIILDAGGSTVEGSVSYLWSTGATSQTINVNNGGEYSVTVTDNDSGCSDTASVTVEQNITPAVAAITGNEILTCDVTSVTLDASTSTADGNFTYLWSNGSTDPSITVSEPNTYSVTITGENGCEDTTSATVEQNITPAVAAITGNEILTCDVTSVSLDASTSTADGNFTYLWSNGSTDPSITVSEPDTYSVTITGENGCEDTTSATVEQNITPAVAAITGNEILTCDVTSVTLDASTSTADGNFTYLWSNGSTDPSITVSEPDTYSVTITGENGCENTTSATVEQNITPAVAAITGNEILTCDVTSVTLDASTSTADGNFTYLWSNGSTDPSITVSEPNTYSVTITGENGCENTTSATVEQNITPAVAAITGNEILTCDVTSVTLDASTSTADGNFTYLWSNGSTDASITVTDPNTYSVTITGENGCQNTTSVSVVENSKTSQAVITGNETLTCTTTSVTLDASTSTADGNFTYLWSNGSTEASIVVSEPDTYSVTISGENGCKDTASVTVEQNIDPANAVIAGNESLTCEVTSVTLDASSSTADGNFTYLWSTGSTDASITVSEPATYSVTITGENGCASEASVTLEAFQDNPDTPTVLGTAVQPTCTTPTGSFEINPVEGLTYSINGGEFSPTTAFVDLSPDSYSVVAKNEYGCTSDPLTVTIIEQPETPNAPVLLAPIHPSCGEEFGAIAICCDTGMEYSLDGINWQNEPFFMNLKPGDYQVVAKNEDGCVSEPTAFTIEPAPKVPGAPELRESATQPTCEVATGSFSITAVEGLEYSFNGGTFESTTVWTGLAPATYTVVARNMDGCESEPLSVTIDSQPLTPATPVLSEPATQPTCEVATGSFSITAEAGMEYSLNGGAFESTTLWTDLTPATYTVEARNADGCVSEPLSVTIDSQPETPATPVLSEPATQPTCEVATGSFSITAEAGLQYSLNGGAFESTTVWTGLAPATYTVVARNMDGCVSEPLSVTIDPQPLTPATPVLSEPATQPTCEAATGSFSISAEDGLEYSFNGGDFGNITSWDELNPETYTVVARNADGCVSNPLSVTINPQPETPAAPVLSGSVDQPNCTISTGSFSILPVAGLEYSFNGGDFGNITSWDELNPETYTVVARNADGCVSEAISVTINAAPETPAAPAVEDFIDASCEEPTGMVVFPLLEGIAYTLTDEDGNVITDENNDAIYNDLEPGMYMVTAENADGCISEPTQVTISSPQLETITPSSGNVCIEETSYDLIPLLGDNDTSGTWEDPENTGALEGSIINPSLLEVGTYTFDYVLTLGECTLTTPVSVSINDDCVVLACELEDVKSSISKVVTPNGDNINDRFEIGLDLDCGFTYNVKIYNRWGSLVFEANDYQNNWDGTSRSSVTGDQLPAGTYYYIVEVIGLDEPVQGYIYLGTK